MPRLFEEAQHTEASVSLSLEEGRSWLIEIIIKTQIEVLGR
jgi:hypothetical protein